MHSVRHGIRFPLLSGTPMSGSDEISPPTEHVHLASLSQIDLLVQRLFQGFRDARWIK